MTTSTRSSRIRRLLMAAAAGVGLTALSATAAHAVGEYHYWKSSSSPLTASGYGSTAKAYGQWRLASGTGGVTSYLDSRVWYTNADNHTVYSTLVTEVNCASVCGTWSWWDDSETSHFNQPSTWKWVYANTSTDPGSSTQARARVNVCIDVPVRVDPCSEWTYAGPSSY
ncbi:hypothetical protein AB0H43_13355 [Hamadaea sp. NPDC050747]|uniref:hypothetical protein n=1 Tax=Hamadaea sp. NPDC050747 TaxID=3155789 RepID=UPI00340916B7